MSDYIGANSFMQGFMQGYGFIDNIHARKRAEARLEQRLHEERNQRAWQRERISKIDAQQQIDRLRRREAEDKLIERQGEYDAANAALAKVRPGDYAGGVAALEPYAHLPEIQAKISEFRQYGQQQADDLLLARGGQQGLQAGAAGAAAGGGAAAAPGTAAAGPGAAAAPSGVAAPVQQFGGPTVYPDAGLPPQGPVAEAQQRLSKADLEEIAVTDPKAAAEARDRQEAEGQTIWQSSGVPDPRGEGRGVSPTSITQQRIRKEEANREATRDSWATNLDINNPTGDAFRSLNPSAQIGQYYRDRSALTPKLQAEGDRLMAPHVEATIAENQELLANPELDPNSWEARAAKRKLNEAYALINARAGFKPNEAAGVVGALPVNGRNQALVDQVIERSVQQPGPQSPGTPSQVAAENRVLERGPKNGRVSSAFTSAAWRKYKRGEIDFPTYQHLVNTGRFPSGATTEIEQFDPKKGPVWAITRDANGNVALQKIIEGSEDADAQAAKLRNLIEGDAMEQINKWGEDLAEQLGTGKNGTQYTMEFFSMLSQNESAARQRGYDYGNIGDISQLWQRYKQLNIVSEAIDNELIYKGQWNTDFQTAFGKTIEEALFSDIGEGDLAELEDPTRTNAFGRGPSPSVIGLKPRDPGLYNAIKQEYPGITDEQIDQILQDM